MSEGTTERYVAQIIEDATGQVVRQSAPTWQRQAEKIEDGMGINLNWERFHTRCVPESQSSDEENAP